MMSLKTRIIAIALAAAMILSLTACGDNKNDPEKGSIGGKPGISAGDDQAKNDHLDDIGQEDNSVSDKMENITSVQIIVDALNEGGYITELGEAWDSDDKYGKFSSTPLHLENGELVLVMEFESEEKAVEYSNCYDESGCKFSSGSEYMIIDYIAPPHFWLSGRFIVQYTSETGEAMPVLNALLGREFAGAGYYYFYPEYARELISCLDAAGISCTCQRTEEYQQLYMYEPKSMCELVTQDGERIYLTEFEEAYIASDHAARFSPDGKTYSGMSGNNAVTIELGRSKPLHLFKNDLIVAEYEGENADIIRAIVNGIGDEFAGSIAEEAMSNAAGEVGFDCQYIRTNGYLDGAVFPQCIIIRSTEELVGYYEANKNQFDLERHETVYSDTTIGWLDAADQYTDEWFKEHDLVFILLESGSGSTRYQVDKVIMNADGSYTVKINRITPEVFTDDMAEWHLFLTVDGGKLNPLTRFDVDMKTVSAE